MNANNGINEKTGGSFWNIISPRSPSLWPTFIYCLILIIALWVLNIVYLFQPSTQAAWDALELSLNKREALMMMIIVLWMITMFSLFPLAIYYSCTWTDWRHAEDRTKRELIRCNLWEELKNEVGEHFKAAYSPETYRLPVILATLSMIVGWVLFFFCGGPNEVWKLANSRDLSAFLVSLKGIHPVVFGFLGSFFFSLQVLLRRYFRVDIKATVFMHIAVRTWLVIILALVLSTIIANLSLPDDDQNTSQLAVLATCFVGGIIPEVVLDLIVKAAKWLPDKLLSDTDAPLTKIQGLNIWHQTRLAEEGIENIQNLAYSDIPGLIANTRLGVRQLLHWIDQAQLYTHVGDDFDRYRKAGIHTAREFEAAYEARHDLKGQTEPDYGFYQIAQTLMIKDEGVTKKEQKAKQDTENKEPTAEEGSEKKEQTAEQDKKASEELKERVRNQLYAIQKDGSYLKLKHLLDKLPI